MIEDLTFLEEGEYTHRDDVVRRIVDQLKYSSRTRLGAISEYISTNLRLDESQKYEIYRKRTASEILKSGVITGCTDVGLAFIVLARESGIPTRYVETFEEDWLLGKSSVGISGHIFVDININGNWEAYEPIRGWTKNNDYTLHGKRYVEAGKGIDFSELYLKDKNGYLSYPVNVSSLKDLGKLGRSMTIRQ